MTKTARSGVFASIQAAASASPVVRASWSPVAYHVATRIGEIAEARTTAAMTGRGRRRMAHAARIATAIHMTWKYLFMSKEITETTITFGTRNRATSHAPRKPRLGVRRMTRASRARTNGIPRFVR